MNRTIVSYAFLLSLLSITPVLALGEAGGEAPADTQTTATSDNRPAVEQVGETADDRPVVEQIDEETGDAPTVFVPEIEPDIDNGTQLIDPRWLAVVFLLLAVLFWFDTRLEDTEQRRKWVRAAFALLVLAGFFGGIILAQDRGGGQDGLSTTTTTRTRHGKCELAAEFGLRVMPPHPTGNERDILLLRLVPGIRIDSNGHLLVKAKNVAVSPYPGTITFVFRRGPSGTTEFHRISQRITNDADLQALMRRAAPRMNAPAGISANNTPITEQLRLMVDYDPENIPDDCDPVRGALTVTWRYNGAPRAFRWQPTGGLASRIRVPKYRSRIRHGDEIIDETTGIPGQVNKATHTWIFFNVDDPFACCGIANKNYTIIQFVRHRWKLGRGPERRDTWNLDGSESQSQQHGQGHDYDPTYTTDPAHGGSTADEDNELVNVGPWDASGGNAVIVEDFPGLLEADHNRFMRQGGWIQWEFVTLLVCKEDNGSAAGYLANGKVRAKTRFRIRRTYAGGDKAPKVLGVLLKGRPEGKPEYYDPCKNLADILRDTQLLNPFNNPRSHRIRLQ